MDAVKKSTDSMTTPKQTPVSGGELMIGNILQYQSGTTLMQGFVTSIPNGKKICIGHVPVKIENVIGVKLTPDILEKCGFEKRAIDRYVFHELKVGDLVFNFSDDKLHFGIQGFANVEWIEYNLTFVHQLQNLYFALTGTHLTINL